MARACSSRTTMSQEGPNRFAEWLLLLREQIPAVRHRLGVWLSAVQEEPALLWQTNVVRYAAFGGGGLLAVWLLVSLVGMLTPPPPASARPTATTADFHVVCANPSCGYHFVVHRRFGFHDFPVKCPRCGQETGTRALLCNSPTCRGRWVAPRKTAKGALCPVCGMRLH